MSSNARNSHKDVARAGRVASQANKQGGRDTTSGSSAQHEKDMSRLNRISESRNK